MIDLYFLNKYLLNNLVNLEKLTNNTNSRKRNSRKRKSRKRTSTRKISNRRNSNNINFFKMFMYLYLFSFILWLLIICYSIWITIVALQYYVDCNDSKIGISVLIPLIFSTLYSLYHYILGDCTKN